MLGGINDRAQPCVRVRGIRNPDGLSALLQVSIEGVGNVLVDE